MLSVTKALKPHLHDTTCCQTSLTTGCIVYTNIQPVVKPVWQTAVSCIQPVVKRVVQPVRQLCWTNSLFVQHGCQTCLTNTVWQPVERTAVRSTRLSNRVCQTGCTTRFDNRLNEQCCSFNTVVKPVWQLVWQPAVSCKWGLKGHFISARRDGVFHLIRDPSVQIKMMWQGWLDESILCVIKVSQMTWPSYSASNMLDVCVGCSINICVNSNILVFSERELTFTFAICYRPSVRLSVCRLSVVCRM